jgi:hypothetical protein
MTEHFAIVTETYSFFALTINERAHDRGLGLGSIGTRWSASPVNMEQLDGLNDRSTF